MPGESAVIAPGQVWRLTGAGNDVCALHHRLAAGVRPAVALREAMLEAVTRDQTNGGRRAWRAVALLTRRTPAPQH